MELFKDSDEDVRCAAVNAFAKFCEHSVFTSSTNRTPAYSFQPIYTPKFQSPKLWNRSSTVIGLFDVQQLMLLQSFANIVCSLHLLTGHQLTLFSWFMFTKWCTGLFLSCLQPFHFSLPEDVRNLDSIKSYLPIILRSLLSDDERELGFAVTAILDLKLLSSI